MKSKASLTEQRPKVLKLASFRTKLGAKAKKDGRSIGLDTQLREHPHELEIASSPAGGESNSKTSECLLHAFAREIPGKLDAGKPHVRFDEGLGEDVT